MGYNCKLCSRHYDDYGNNGQPLCKGRVCDECNEKVIDYRMIDIQMNTLYNRIEELEKIIEELKQQQASSPQDPAEYQQPHP